MQFKRRQLIRKSPFGFEIHPEVNSRKAFRIKLDERNRFAVLPPGA